MNALRTAPWLFVLAALAGCSVLGGKQKDPATIFAPDPHVVADPSWPSVHWELTVGHPTAARMIDSLRIAVRPAAGEIEVYHGANWAKTPSEMLEDTILRTLEDSGKIRAVARQGSSLGTDYKLELDLRRFDADYAGNAVPAATIEVNAKLLHLKDQELVAGQTFRAAMPASGTAVPTVAIAFEQALASIGHDIGGWVLASGEAHQRGKHR